MGGHLKFLGRVEGGVLKATILEVRYEVKLEFFAGRGTAKQKTSCGGSMDIFWNCTVSSGLAGLKLLLYLWTMDYLTWIA